MLVHQGRLIYIQQINNKIVLASAVVHGKRDVMECHRLLIMYAL